MNEIENTDKTFLCDIRHIIDSSRQNAVRSVDFCRVQMYWHLGKRIFEEEQHGKNRADYGTYLIKNLAKQLEPEYGSGFGVRQLEQSRQFYRMYPIANAVRSQLNWTRQKRILLEDDEFFADLVFYNRLLRCFVIIELKTGKLTHQDLGQLEMYVNYYDRVEKSPDENRTIGILLCTDKNDTAVRMALPEDNQTILASKYQLYLPTQAQLIDEINHVKQSLQQEEKDIQNQ